MKKLFALLGYVPYESVQSAPRVSITIRGLTMLDMSLNAVQLHEVMLGEPLRLTLNGPSDLEIQVYRPWG